MKHFCKAFCIAYLLFANWQTGEAQTLGIMGCVLDSSRQAVDGATITVRPISKGGLNAMAKAKQVFSNEAGCFGFSIAMADSIELIIHCIGYNKYINKFPAPLLLDTLRLGDIVLESSALKIKDVLIVAKKKTIEFKSDRIVYNVANDPDRNSSQLIDLLQKVPMVTLGENEAVQLKGKSNFKLAFAASQVST